MKNVLFWFVCFAPFLYQGLGLPYGERVSLIIGALFLLVFLITRRENSYLTMSRITTGSIALYMGGSFLLLPLSSDIPYSLEYLIGYILLFSLFILFQTYKPSAQFIVKGLLAVAVIFSLYSVVIKTIPAPLSAFLPSYNTQLVAQVDGHSNLGHIAALVISIFAYLYIVSKKQRMLVPVLFLIPFLVISYSRTAYLSLALTLAAMMWQTARKKEGILIVIVFLSVLFISTTKEAFAIPILKNIYTFLIHAGIPYKSFFSGRLFYISEALAAIGDKPLAGFGPGNYLFGSAKHAILPGEYTYTSFNIILDSLAENGILMGLLFLSIIMLPFFSTIRSYFPRKKSDPYKTALVFGLISMMISFLFDNIYRSLPYMGLFFLIVSTLWQDRKTIRINPLVIAVPTLLALIVLFHITSATIAYNHKNYALAYRIYPLHPRVYAPLMFQAGKTNDLNTWTLLKNRYERIFPGSPWVFEFIGDEYVRMGKPQQAIPYYDRMYKLEKFPRFERVQDLYHLKMSVEGKEKAHAFAQDYVNRLSEAPYFPLYPHLMKEVMVGFCEKNNLVCPPVLYKDDSYRGDWPQIPISND